MSLSGSSSPTPSAVELLDRAIGYTRGSLARVTPEVLHRPTPCAQWSLIDLLLHMDDSLAAMCEAARAPSLALAPAPGPVDPGSLLVSIRRRACSLVTEWMEPGEPTIALGPAHLARETLGAVGALEITLHGWDVATALGLDRPIPPTLAMDLWPWARDHITDEDRPVRFGPAQPVPVWAPPQARLLAQAGRRDLRP